MVNHKPKQKKGKKKGGSKPNNKKPRQPRGTNRQTITPRMNHAANMSAVHTVCGMLDPFCAHSHGMKIHDENQTRSSTYKSVYVDTISTNGTGVAMSWYNSNPSALGYSANITGAVATSWTTRGANGFSGMIGNGMSGWRVVSFGVRLFTAMPAMTAQGLITVSEVHGMNISTTTNLIVGSTVIGQNTKVFPLANSNIHWTGRSAGINGNMYEADLGTLDYDNFTSLVISVTGGVFGQAVLSVEIITNYEFIPTPFTAFAGVATPAAPYVPALMTARANAGSMMDTIQNVQSTAAYSAEILKSVTATGVAVNNAASQLAPAMRTARTMASIAGLML